jgi:hypothetical protein
MAPRAPALAQSESKARFFERLGLDENNELHRRVYAMMKVRYYHRHSSAPRGVTACLQRHRKKLLTVGND